MLNNDTPFFWLGDTAWVLKSRGPDDVDYYMSDRSRKGFNVVQVMAIRVDHRDRTGKQNQPIPNYDGELPFTGRNPVAFYEGYWSVFSGAFGFTYGANRVWQCRGEWKNALQYEGASDMQHLRNLMESRPMVSMVPDQTLLLSENGDMGKEPSYCAILREKNGQCALVYSTMGQQFKMDVSKLSGSAINAWWYSPRDGLLYAEKMKQIHRPFTVLHSKEAFEFTPPSNGLNQDWVLVLDDAAAGYPQSGTHIE